MAGILDILAMLDQQGMGQSVGPGGTPMFNPSVQQMPYPAPPVGPGMGPPGMPPVGEPGGMSGPPVSRAGGMPGQQQQPQGPGGIGGLLLDPKFQFGLNLLSQSGPSLKPQSFASNIGRAGLMTAGMQQQQKMQEVQRKLLEAQAGLANRRTTQDPMAGKRRVQSAQPLENGNIGYLDAFTGQVVDTGVKAGTRTQVVDVPGQGQMVFDPVEKTLIPVSSEQQVQDSMRQRKTAETEGANDPKARQEKPKNILALDQKIERADMFIKQLESGQLDSGILEGKISRFTPEGQDFQSFVGENIVNLISSATFGQLSEGERLFLSTISFSLDKDEPVNIADLKRFKQILQKAKEIEQSELSRIQGADEFEGFSIAPN